MAQLVLKQFRCIEKNDGDLAAINLFHAPATNPGDALLFHIAGGGSPLSYRWRVLRVEGSSST